MLLEVVPDFVKILGYGLSGFAFLLMFFTYMLLRQVITRKTQNKMIFKLIWGFMGLSFLFTIVVAVFSFMTGDYKKTELANNEKMITQQQNGLDVLTETQTIDSIAQKATEIISTDTAKVNETKKNFEKNIADLQAKLDKVNATPEDKRKVALLKEESAKTLDSLKRTDISEETRLRLNNKLQAQANEISRISTTAVKRDLRTTVWPTTRRRQ